MIKQKVKIYLQRFNINWHFFASDSVFMALNLFSGSVVSVSVVVVVV